MCAFKFHFTKCDSVVLEHEEWLRKELGTALDARLPLQRADGLLRERGREQAGLLDLLLALLGIGPGALCVLGECSTTGL